MKKICVVLVILVFLAAMAQYAFLQSRPRATDGAGNYGVASHLLKAKYMGPSKFSLSGLNDPETKLEAIPGGYVVHGTMESDSPEILQVSGNGKVRFRATVMGPKKQYWIIGPSSYTIAVDDVELEAAP